MYTMYVGANGDFYTLLSVKNKQDYARKYGYQFLLSMKQTDVNLKGAWNKVFDILKQVHICTYVFTMSINTGGRV
jgi:hypothetical protein